MEKLARIFQSNAFKRITFVLSIITWALTFVYSFHTRSLIKFGYPGVFLFNAIGGVGTILVPILSRRMNVLMLAAVTALGMAVNDSIAYVIGRSGTSFFPDNTKSQAIARSLNKYGIYALFVWSVIPFPYDIIGLICGFMQYPYKKFLGATFFGKFIRFVLLGYGVNLILLK